MTHPIFRKNMYIETPFEIRFQAMLRYAWDKRSWHVIVADPGSGKTVGIHEMIKTAGRSAILAVVAPKNDEDEQALGDQFYAALGVQSKGHWRTRKPRLMGHLHQSGTECLVVDDAHDLSLEHLMFLKELTDQGHLQYDHPFGVCLVAAGRGNTIPLKEYFDQPETTWQQFFRRLDQLEPYCRIEGHTSEEVREILAALEKVYALALPQLNLLRWGSSIYTWLTNPVLDPTHSGRVTMNYLMKLVKTALEWSYEAKSTDVLIEMLEKAATLLVLRRNTLWIIDGVGPSVKADHAERTEPVQTSETQAEQVSSPNEGQKIPSSVSAEQTTQARSQKKAVSQAAASDKCTFSGVVPIDLKRFEESGVALVECPGCGRAWTLSPHAGGLRFKSHDKRKTNTPNTEPRWVKGKVTWETAEDSKGNARIRGGRTAWT
jgi:AAA domain